LNYLEFAAPFKYSFGFKKIKFQLLAGPILGFGIGGKYTMTADGYDNSGKVVFMPYSANEDSYRYFADVDKRIDKSLVFGVGVELYNHFIIDIRYQKSLSRLYTQAGRDDYNNDEIEGARNNLWQFSIGIPLKLFPKVGEGEESIRQKSNLIPTAGLTISTISLKGSNIKKYNKLGYTVGLAYNVDINNTFCFMPELRFIQKGLDFYDQDYKHFLTLYYVETVLPIKYRVERGNYRFSAHLGPTFGLGIDGRYSIYDFDEKSINVHFKHLPKEIDSDYYYAYLDNKFEVGYQAGIGMELYRSIMFELSYSQGLTKLYSNVNRESYNNSAISNAKNSTWIVKVGVPLNYHEKRIPIEPSRLLVNAGIAITNMSYQALNPSSRIGFTVGVAYETEIARNTFIQPEINFIQKGAKWSFDKGDNHEMKINYLELPISIKYTLDFSKIRMSMLIGPYIGIGLGGNYMSQFNGKTNNLPIKFSSYNESDDYDEKYSYVDRRFEVGASAGLGFEFFRKVSINFRYSIGVSELYTDWNRGLLGDSDILKGVKNRGYIISVGFPVKVLSN
jgi:hypothetical protein